MTFAANTSCTLSVKITDLPITNVTKASMKLYNELGEMLEYRDLDIGEEEIKIEIEADRNFLDPDVAMGYRHIDLYVENTEGTFIEFIEYFLVGEIKLEIMKNSYQTYGEAQLTATSCSDMQSWIQEYPREDKISSLVSAFYKMGQLCFKVDDRVINNLNSLSKSDFLSLNPNFVNAIRRAQVIESNALSAYNIGDMMKRQGVLSSTIGETSQMFKTGNTAINKLSYTAINELTGWLYRNVTIGRA